MGTKNTLLAMACFSKEVPPPAFGGMKRDSQEKYNHYQGLLAMAAAIDELQTGIQELSLQMRDIQTRLKEIQRDQDKIIERQLQKNPKT